MNNLRLSSKAILSLLLLCACLFSAGPAWSAIILASFQATNEVRQYDSVSGTDLGVFASGFADPSGIAYDAKNFIVYVADYSANSVSKYSTSGAFLGSFGSGFNNPEDVAVDALGNVYVANYGNFTVTKFSTAGTLLTTITLGGTSRAEGLGFASNGDLLANIYTGTSGGKIQRYNATTGAFISTFATPGGNIAPMVVDASGNVYVAHLVGSNTLFKYSSAGTLLTSASLGFGAGGLALNEAGDLLVSNTIPGNSINRYDSNLNFINAFASPASNPFYLGSIPEPSRALLLIFGLAGFALRRRRTA